MFDVARAWFKGSDTLNFEVFVPPEMREAMTLSGALAPRISRSEALQVPAVLRGRNLIAGTLASLPVHLRDPQRNIVQRSEAPTTLFDQIDPDLPNEYTYAATYEDLLFEAESLWRVLERNFAGWPTFCQHIEHSRWGVHPGRGISIDGQLVNDADVIRFYSPNPPVLRHAARAIRTCLALDQAAAKYADEPVPLGAFTAKEGRRVGNDDQKVTDFLDKFKESIRRRAWGWIPDSVEPVVLQFNAEQIQLAEQRQHAVLEIARAMGIDPEDLGVSTTSRTYQNAEQRRLDLVDFTFRHYMIAVEQRLSMKDVIPRGYRAKVNLDAFLRGTTKERMDTYKVGREVGAYSDARIADLEDIPSARVPRPVPALVPVPEEANGARTG